MESDPRTGTIDSDGKINKITAGRGEEVTWDWGEPKHTVSIWVPDKSVFDACHVVQEAELPCYSKISGKAPLDTTHEYVIYDHTDGKFVEGNSHPKIEIPGG